MEMVVGPPMASITVVKAKGDGDRLVSGSGRPSRMMRTSSISMSMSMPLCASGMAGTSGVSEVGKDGEGQDVGSQSVDEDDISMISSESPYEKTMSFADAMHKFLGESGVLPDFNEYGRGGVRNVMEPYLRSARLDRERALSSASALLVRGSSAELPQTLFGASIGSSIGVPYTALRRERPFLFDEHTHPLHMALAKALGVSSLALLHEHFPWRGGTSRTGGKEVLAPLRDCSRRREFHMAYDSFVTSHCIPLLHAVAISQRVFHKVAGGNVAYRYQAFPTVEVVRPGECVAPAPTCDAAEHRSIGYLSFYVPLTPSFGTNCLFTESHPGREDWHPLSAKSVGLAYLFDGARCLHFGLRNTTDCTRVSLHFRVLLYRDTPKPRSILNPLGDLNSLFGDLYENDDDDAFMLSMVKGTSYNLVIDTELDNDNDLCPLALLEDAFSQEGPGYYDDVVVDATGGGWESRHSQLALISARAYSVGGTTAGVVRKKRSTDNLLDPDHRNGHPFFENH